MGPGQIYSVEQGISVSNVALIDPVHKLPTRAGWRFARDENGFERRVRVSKLTGEEIPRVGHAARVRTASNGQHHGTVSLRVGEFATRPEDVSKVTFVPSLSTPPLPKDCHL